MGIVDRLVKAVDEVIEARERAIAARDELIRAERQLHSIVAAPEPDVCKVCGKPYLPRPPRWRLLSYLRFFTVHAHTWREWSEAQQR